MSTVLTYGVTSSPAVTLTSAAIYTNNTNKPVVVRYVSDRATHISLVGSASASDAFVPANCVELINVDPGKSINAIRESSETDGPVWVTVVARV